MANRLTKLSQVDVVLSNLARGYIPGGYVNEHLFPVVPVEKENARVPTFGKEAFQIRNTHRALRGSSNIIVPDDSSYTQLELKEYDAAYPIDYREEIAARGIFNLRRHAMTVAQSSIMLQMEQFAATEATTAGNYASSNKVTLSGTSQFTHASSNPFDTIETGKYAVKTATGNFPNVLVLSAQSYKALRTNTAVLDRLKYTGQMVSAEVLARLFDVEKVVVATAATANDAGTLTDIWSDYCVLAYVPKLPLNERTPYTPTYGSTFVLDGFPAVDEFQSNDKKVDFIRSTSVYQVKGLGFDAGYLIIDTNA